MAEHALHKRVLYTDILINATCFTPTEFQPTKFAVLNSFYTFYFKFTIIINRLKKEEVINML